MESLRTIESGDAIWLRIGEPGSNYVSSGVLFFRGRCQLDRIYAELRRALVEYPKLASVPVTDERGRLRWQPLAGFDILDNVDAQSLSARLTERDDRLVPDDALESTLATLVESELAPGKPLWRVAIVHGLSCGADEAFCVVLKTHHAVADGVAYYDILTNVCGHGDRGRHASRDDAAPRPPTWRESARALFGRVRYLLAMLRPERKSALFAADRDGSQLLVSAAHPVAAPARHAKSAGVSLNALILALFARSLADWVRARTGACPKRIRAVLPVNVHRRSEDTKHLVNQLGYLHVALALDNDDSLVVARHIDAQIKRYKAHGNDAMMQTISNLITRLPPTLTRLAHRIFASRASLVVSCFGFPAQPLTLADGVAFNIGAFPVIPQPLNLSSMIVVHGGAVTLYLRSNSAHQPHLDEILTRFAGHLARLVEAAPATATAGIAA